VRAREENHGGRMCNTVFAKKGGAAGEVPERRKIQPGGGRPNTFDHKTCSYSARVGIGVYTETITCARGKKKKTIVIRS